MNLKSHQTTDPRRISGSAAALAIGTAIAAALLLVALHLLSPEYSPAWRMVSEYANGHYAWVLSLMFAAYGCSTLALAFAIRSQVDTRANRIGLGPWSPQASVRPPRPSSTSTRCSCMSWPARLESWRSASQR